MKYGDTGVPFPLPRLQSSIMHRLCLPLHLFGGSVTGSVFHEETGEKGKKGRDEGLKEEEGEEMKEDEEKEVYERME